GFVLGQVFIDAGWRQLFYSQPQPALFSIDFENLRLNHLADFQNVLRMVDSFFGADVADVNHSFDSLGNLNKGAELRQANHRPLDHRAIRKFLFGIGPRIAQRLLQPQRDSLFAGIDSKNHDLDRLARFHQIGGLAHTLDP